MNSRSIFPNVSEFPFPTEELSRAGTQQRNQPYTRHYRTTVITTDLQVNINLEMFSL